MNVCDCCGNPMKGQRCHYCGFIERSYSDVASIKNNEIVERQVSEYKSTEKYIATILSNVSSISVKANKYQWNGKTDSFDTIEEVELFDPKLSGKDYYRNTVYSKQEIHQVGIGVEQTIEINYSFAGSPKKAIVKLTPVQSYRPWRMSLEIDEKLRLIVMLGDLCDHKDEVPPAPDKHAWAAVDLDLHA